MSMIKEHSLKHKRTESMEYETEKGNPFRAPMKKIKNIDSLNLWKYINYLENLMFILESFVSNCKQSVKSFLIGSDTNSFDNN